MTVKDLFSFASTETCFKVCVRDMHWHYLETPEGDSVFDVNLCEPDVFYTTLQKVFEYHISEWWVHISSGTVHIVVVEDL